MTVWSIKLGQQFYEGKIYNSDSWDGLGSAKIYPTKFHATVGMGGVDPDDMRKCRIVKLNINEIPQ